ncbi:MAG TPA: hypothetical protein VNM24_12085 [Burkholderiales bacterium]|nr:hypothetical protein [Burkholderiales bacterium]
MIPLWLKIGYTLFVCFLVPIYWRQYGLSNFLWFSDIALLMLVPALWLESPLLVSMMALAVLLPELAWNADYFFRLATGRSLIGLADYMFDQRIPRFIRGLSLFHVVLPALLVWLLDRLGYDGRALVWQTVVAAVVLPLSYFLSNPRENVNWVYGFGGKPQSRVPAPLFVALLMVAIPLAIYLPTDLLLSSIFGAAGR